MSRPRIPTAQLEASGGFDRHPERRRVDPETGGPLPVTAPAHLSAAEKVIWGELVLLAPARVLADCDLYLVELTVRLIAKLRDGTINGAQSGQLLACLGRMGMTPADRSKVTASKETEGSEWDEIDNS